MRLINLIDNCGQLLSAIHHSTTSADRTAEAFFRQKRKLIGSKERKFISQTVWTTLRNLLLTKNIVRKLGLHNKLAHKNIFPNAAEAAVVVLVQILLIETYPADFDCLEIGKILYKKDGSLCNLLESICTDIEIIKGIDADTKQLLIAFLTNELPPQVTAFYSDVKLSTLTLCKNHAQTQVTSNLLEHQAVIIDAVATRFSFPRDFLSNLLPPSGGITANNLYNFAGAMNVAAPVCLRVNQSLCDVETVLSDLRGQQIQCDKSQLTPAGIVVKARPQLTTLESYKKGYFTVQDEASQMVGYCVNPKPADSILDACAGAGGKSLHLADIQRDGGDIVAADISQIKIRELGKRAELSHFKSITTEIVQAGCSIGEDERAIRQLRNRRNGGAPRLFDIVLVDAPCTGAGTIRRDPTKKYSINTKTIKKTAAKQIEILTGYSKYVKPGGVLVYSTCSIFAEENEMVVERFLLGHPHFTGEPLQYHLAEHGIQLAGLCESDYYITLYPFIHGTDGFFICRLRQS